MCPCLKSWRWSFWTWTSTSPSSGPGTRSSATREHSYTSIYRQMGIVWMYVSSLFTPSWGFKSVKYTATAIPFILYIPFFWELRGLSPNFYIHVSVSDLYIPRISPHISSSRKGRPIVGIFNSLTDIFLFWEYFFQFSAFCLCSVEKVNGLNVENLGVLSYYSIPWSNGHDVGT